MKTTSCPPCNQLCEQGRECPSLTTRNGGNVISNGKPLLPRQSSDSDDLEDLVLRWIGGTVLGAAMVMIAGFLMSFFI